MEFILLIVGIVGLVWGAALFLRGGLVTGGLIVLVASFCFGQPFYTLHLGPLPLTIDRVLWGGLVGLYLVWRWMRRADPKPLGAAEYALLGFCATLVFCTFVHDWQDRKYQPVALLIFFYLVPVSLYWIVRQSAITERDVKLVFGVLAAFGVYLAVTAVAETQQLSWMIFPKYIVTNKDAEFFGRGRGPFLNPSGNGLVMSVCLCAALMWWPRLQRQGQMALLGVVGVCLVGLYCTLTRSVWMGAALALAIVVGLALKRSTRVVLVGGGLLLATLLVASEWENFLSFKRDKYLSEQETAESVKLRPILARVAWNMFLDRPLLGCGLGQYPTQCIYYLNDRTTELPLEKARIYIQHNVFLALLTETGLVGMGLFTLMLWFWVRDAWRLWQSRQAPLWARQQGLLFLALMASYLVNAMFHDVSRMPAVTMLLFFMAGVTAGLRGEGSWKRERKWEVGSRKSEVGVVEDRRVEVGSA
jgi:hypothetical protein